MSWRIYNLANPQSVRVDPWLDYVVNIPPPMSRPEPAITSLGVTSPGERLESEGVLRLQSLPMTASRR